jgi:hypothetical protein
MRNAASFRARREQVLLRLFLRITRVMTLETVERVRALGITQMQPSFPWLLGNLDTEGTRIGALARRMGTSRQAASQLSKKSRLLDWSNVVRTRTTGAALSSASPRTAAACSQVPWRL